MTSRRGGHRDREPVVGRTKTASRDLDSATLRDPLSLSLSCTCGIEDTFGISRALRIGY